MAGSHLIRGVGTIWTPVPAPSGAEALPQSEPNLSKFQMPAIGLVFDHDLALSPAGYFDAFYYSALQGEQSFARARSARRAGHPRAFVLGERHGISHSDNGAED